MILIFLQLRYHFHVTTITLVMNMQRVLILRKVFLVHVTKDLAEMDISVMVGIANMNR